MAFAVPADPAFLRQLLEQGDTARYEAMLHHEKAVHQLAPQRLRMHRAPASDPDSESPFDPVFNFAPRGLVILANFSDKQFRAENTRVEMDSMLNAEDYNYGNAYGSARKYFYEQSNGLYHPHFDVVGPVDLPESMAYYGANNGYGEDQLLGDFVLHACSIASQLPDVDFSNYDNDNDGFLDFVYIIHAGYGEADGGGDDTMWPASFEMTSAYFGGYTSLRGYEDYDDFFENIMPMYTFDGITVGSFAYSNELRNAYGDNPQRTGINTFCHEFSHVIGLPDYYDPYYGSNNDNEMTPGYWSLMDAGSWLANGEVPPGYSVFDKYYLGWATPVLLDSSRLDTLPVGDLGYRYITATHTSEPATTLTTTYYIENRQMVGWDYGLPGHGMLVWQVTYNPEYWFYNEPNASYSADYTTANMNGDVCLTLLSATNRDTGLGTRRDSYPGTLNKHQCILPGGDQLLDIQEEHKIITYQFVTEDEPSAVESIATGASNGKFIRNGQLFIRHNGHTYTITGTPID